MDFLSCILLLATLTLLYSYEPWGNNKKTMNKAIMMLIINDKSVDKFKLKTKKATAKNFQIYKRLLCIKHQFNGWLLENLFHARNRDNKMFVNEGETSVTVLPFFSHYIIWVLLFEAVEFHAPASGVGGRWKNARKLWISRGSEGKSRPYYLRNALLMLFWFQLKFIRVCHQRTAKFH